MQLVSPPAPPQAGCGGDNVLRVQAQHHEAVRPHVGKVPVLGCHGLVERGLGLRFAGLLLEHGGRDALGEADRVEDERNEDCGDRDDSHDHEDQGDRGSALPLPGQGIREPVNERRDPARDGVGNIGVLAVREFLNDPLVRLPLIGGQRSIAGEQAVHYC